MAEYNLEKFTKFNNKGGGWGGSGVPATSPIAKNALLKRFSNPETEIPQMNAGSTFGGMDISDGQYDDLMKVFSLSEAGMPDKYLNNMLMQTIFKDPQQEQEVNLDNDLKLASALTSLGDIDGAKQIMSNYSPSLGLPDFDNGILTGGAESLEDIVAGIEDLPLRDRETILDQYIANETNAGKKLAAQKLKELYTSTDQGGAFGNIGILNDIKNRADNLFRGSNFEDYAKKENANSRNILKSKYEPYLNAYGI